MLVDVWLLGPVLLLAAALLAVCLLAGCSGLGIGPQRVAVTHQLEADATIDFTIPVEVVSYE